ncbi:hypothetical protein BRARA_I03025 [Brassica rapa]|uniref:NTF2 domain-containing protein n=4 Tax=Brassica TaxID=3705 RepID=A0A397Y6Y4_BRACM|nr:hypothetical protein BRARA_I03025 [Brassica rapa]
MQRQEFMSSFTLLLPAHSLFYDLVSERELKKRDTSLFSCSASKGFDTHPLIPHFGHSSCVASITSAVIANTGRCQLDFLPSPDLALMFISSSISCIFRVASNMQIERHTKVLRTTERERERERKTREMDPDAVAKAFVEHYYTTFDSNRAGLVSLYQEGSMLTFEGQKIQGSQNIVAKLTSLPFQQCKHNITTVDCQPSGPAGGMLVFVSGNLQLAGEQHALKFSQMFHLVSNQGNYYVFNDIFRLNYA